MATKTAADKAPNYTPEQESVLLKGYTVDGYTVEQLGELVGKSVRSIVAKLSRMGVYKKKTYVSKTGEAPVKKDTQADTIGRILGLSENDTDSLTKANKTALKAIMLALANSKPAHE